MPVRNDAAKASWARLGGALFCVVLVVSSAACGTTETSGPASDSSMSTPTTSGATTSTTSTTTTAVHKPAGLMPADLPLCDDQDRYYTVTEWLLSNLPEGFWIAAANTYVERGDPATEVDRAESWLLIERSSNGGVAAAFSISRGATPQEPYPASDLHETNTLNEVRGLPGSVTHQVNRGDSLGWSVAEWTEEGVAWSASSRFDGQLLAEALTNLDLSGESIDDSTGRFEVAGHVPAGRSGPLRVTSIELRTGSAEEDRPVTVYIRIDEQPDGSSGMNPGLGTSWYTFGPGSKMFALGDRSMVAYGPPEPSEMPDEMVDASGFAVAALPDGSTVDLRWIDPAIATGPVWNPLRVEALLADIVSALVPAPADDPRLVEIPLLADDGTPAENDGSYCAEPK